MHLYRDVLQKLTLFDMSIPGTHDAGTYQLEDPLGMINVVTIAQLFRICNLFE